MRFAATLSLCLILPWASSAQPPRHDDHGELLPQHAVARIGDVRLRHGNTVGSIAFTGDGKKIASTDWYSVATWNAQTGATIQHRMINPGGWPAVSGDGALIACYLNDESFGVQEVESGRNVCAFPKVEGRLHGITFTRDNHYVSAFDDESVIYLWDIRAGKQMRTWESPQKGFDSRQAFTPDAKLLIHGTHDGDLFAMNVTTGDKIWHAKPKKAEGREYYLNGLSISPDGEVVAIMHHWRRLELWNAKTGQFLREFECHRSWHGPVFTPDGKSIMCSSFLTGEFLFWDVTSGKLARKISYDPRVYPESFAFSPGGKRLAVGGHDYAVHVWDLETGKEEFPPPEFGGDASAQVLRDGKTIVTRYKYWNDFQNDTFDPRLVHWDFAGRLLQKKTFDVEDRHLAALAPDGDVIALASGPNFGGSFRPTPNAYLLSSIELRDVGRGKEIVKVDDVPCQVTDMEFSPDGRFLFVPAFNAGPNPGDYHHFAVVQVWKRSMATKLEKVADLRTSEWLNPICCSSDSRWVCVASETGYVFYDCETGSVLRQIRLTGTVQAASPNGRVMACTNDKKRTAFLVEALTGGVVCKLEGNPQFLHRPHFVFSPDGRIVAGDLFGEKLHLWDALTGKEVGVLDGHRGGVNSLSFTPDGQHLVSASSDSTCLIWDYRKAIQSSPAKDELTGEELDRLVEDLGSANASVAYAAVARLVRSPGRTIARLKQKIKPAVAADIAPVESLVADLDRPSFAVRERAAAELMKLGPVAEEPLRQALDRNPTLEAKRRIARLLDDLAAVPATADWLMTIRALQAVELINDEASQLFVQEICAGLPQATKTQEARRVLERIKPRSSR